MSRIGEQLKILSIFHYIVGGLYGLYFGFSMLMGGMVGLMAFWEEQKHRTVRATSPDTVGLIIVGSIFGLFFLLALAYAILTIWSGYCIAKRKRRFFSLVMASVNFLAFPFGTTLGIFTFIMLRSEAAVWWYAGGQEEPPPVIPENQQG